MYRGLPREGPDFLYRDVAYAGVPHNVVRLFTVRSPELVFGTITRFYAGSVMHNQTKSDGFVDVLKREHTAHEQPHGDPFARRGMRRRSARFPRGLRRQHRRPGKHIGHEGWRRIAQRRIRRRRRVIPADGRRSMDRKVPFPGAQRHRRLQPVRFGCGREHIPDRLDRLGGLRQGIERRGDRTVEERMRVGHRVRCARLCLPNRRGIQPRRHLHRGQARQHGRRDHREGLQRRDHPVERPGDNRTEPRARPAQPHHHRGPPFRQVGHDAQLRQLPQRRGPKRVAPRPFRELAERSGAGRQGHIRRRLHDQTGQRHHRLRRLLAGGRPGDDRRQGGRRLHAHLGRCRVEGHRGFAGRHQRRR